MKQFPFSIKIFALDKFSTTFANVSSKFDRLGKKATTLGKNLSIGLSLPVAAFGTLAVKKAAEFDTLRTALETATGSVEAAREEFKTLQDFAATTPFALDEVVTAFIKLKNLGLDPSKEALTSYGNTAGAMGKSLNQMIEAVADAATFEFERLKEFGIKANQQGNYVTFTFRGVKTKVRKEASEITKYLEKIGNVQFAGGMEKQAATIGGAFSNLQDSVSIALDKVGSSIAQSLKLNDRVRMFSDEINKLADGFQRLPEPVKKFASYAGLAVIALGPLVGGLGTFLTSVGVLVALAPKIAAGFAWITTVLGPWGIFAGLVAGIVYMFVRLVQNAGGVGRAIALLGTTVLDMFVAPLRIVLQLVTKIWSLFGTPPAGLSRLANGSMTRDLATYFQQGDQADAESRARSYVQKHNELYQLQNRAMKGDKAAIEVLFKNAPPGMRAKVDASSTANVTVDQGVGMQAGY